MYWTLVTFGLICMALWLFTGKDVMAIASHVYIAAALASLGGK